VPPSDFLFTFREIFRECGEAWSEIVDSHTELTEGTAEAAIRIVLGGAAKLAKKFDGVPDEVIYAANIMLFTRADRLDDRRIAELKPSLRFATPETDLRALRGVLVIERELSTTTRSGALGQPDGTILPLALGVPLEIRDEKSRKWRVLPGAPMAFCTGRIEAYLDTFTLGEWCRREGDFPASIANSIDDYFSSQRAEAVRSFISIPMKASESVPIGILNIHRNRPGLLEEKEPVEQFAPLVDPLIFILVRLLDTLQTLRDNK